MRALICWLLSHAERFLFPAGSGDRGGWQFWESCLQASFLRSFCGCRFYLLFQCLAPGVKRNPFHFEGERSLVSSFLKVFIWLLSSVCRTEASVHAGVPWHKFVLGKALQASCLMTSPVKSWVSAALRMAALSHWQDCLLLWSPWVSLVLLLVTHF